MGRLLPDAILRGRDGPRRCGARLDTAGELQRRSSMLEPLRRVDQPLVHVPTNSGQVSIPTCGVATIQALRRCLSPTAGGSWLRLGLPGPSLRFPRPGFCGRSFRVNKGSGEATACVLVSVATTSLSVCIKAVCCRFGLSISLSVSGHTFVGSHHWIAMAVAASFLCGVAILPGRIRARQAPSFGLLPGFV